LTTLYSDPRRWDYGIRVSRRLVTKYDSDLDPLTLGMVRDQHLRVTNDGHEDGYIDSLIATSLRMCQRRTQRRILPETWALDLSAFPSCHIEIPFAPLIEVVSVKYYADGVLTTMDADGYAVDAPSGHEAVRGTIRLVDGGSWPTPDTRPDAVHVTFRTGYVDPTVSPEVVDVPEDITHGRLLMIKDLYENRGSQNVGAGVAVSRNITTANELWDGYRDRTVAG
jgi:uncharacterized phiE125 gp8 family phage protein